MCDHPKIYFPRCASAAPSPASRRTFLTQLAGAAAVAGWSTVARSAAAQPSPEPAPRTSWAWLVTPGQDWDAHIGSVPLLADFIRQETKLEISSQVQSVKPSNLEQLCAAPFIFSHDLTKIKNPQELLNLREYLYRGGFIYVDGCVNPQINPSLRVFYERHLAFLPKLLPGVELRRLGADHPIFRAHFPLRESEVTKFYVTNWPQALYGMFDDNRMVLLLSLQTLFCGWPQDPEKMQTDLRQIANIYLYALAR